jgi:16S rRNA (guanine527-N7)-methyltransferase
LQKQKQIIEIPTITTWEEGVESLKWNLSIVLSARQEEKLKLFYNLLYRANLSMNLTKLSSEPDFLTFHLLDTALVLKALQAYQKAKVTNYIDLGSGCGVPGIILHILLFETYSLKTLLCDSRLKRIEYLNEILPKLSLNGPVQGVCDRTEKMVKNKNYKNNFSLITARAFAKPTETLRAALPLLTKNGLFVYQTSCSLTADPDYKATLGHAKAKIVDELGFTLAGKRRFVGLVAKS